MRAPDLRAVLLIFAVSTCGLSRRAEAVIVLGGTGNNFVSAASPVPYAINGHSLDQYTGDIEGFLGTPISSRYFVTANHITGNATDQFTYANGTGAVTTYPVKRVGNEDDLAVWEIEPSDASNFTLYAPLYTSSNEIGQSLVVLGNGTTRGAAVTGGFAEGGSTGQTSYGTNTVIATPVAGVSGFTTPSSNFAGDFLQYAFDATSNNPNEAILSGGDSGGPDFVLDPSDNTYKLAGVNSLVDQVDDANGNALSYALYDDTGYYYQDAMGNVLPITGTDAGPLSSYATRISSRLGFIDSVTGIPEPTGLILLVPVAITGLACRRRGTVRLVLRCD